MFGRRGQQPAAGAAQPGAVATGADRGAARGPTAVDSPPRPPESARRAAMASPAPAGERKLVVGRDISVSGEINSCEILFVEGRVQANLGDCRVIEIAESGSFKGGAQVDRAEIAGRFEGTLTARERLVVRATGRLSGEVRYARLEVEGGGEITGQVACLSHSPGAATLAPQRAEPRPYPAESRSYPEPRSQPSPGSWTVKHA